MKLIRAAPVLATAASSSSHGTRTGRLQRRQLGHGENHKYASRTLLQQKMRGYYSSQRGKGHGKDRINTSRSNNFDRDVSKEFFGPQSCDPTSTDPDVGILSCERGSVCRRDRNSVLGGSCQQEPSLSRLEYTRRLQVSDDDWGGFEVFCDPYSSYFDDDCDCSAWYLLRRTGRIECNVYDSYCFEDDCSEFCSSFTIVYERRSASIYDFSVGYCYNFTVPYPQGFCYYFDYGNFTCDIRLNDEMCDYCAVDVHVLPTFGDNETDHHDDIFECATFNCSNTDPTISGSVCYGYVSAPILSYECESSSSPSLTPNGSLIPSSSISPTVPMFETNTSTLYPTRDQEQASNESYVSSAQPTISPTDGASSMIADPTFDYAETFVCNICGRGGTITRPDAVVETPDTRLIPTASCAEIQKFVRKTFELPYCLIVVLLVSEQCGCMFPSTSSNAAPSTAPSSAAPYLSSQMVGATSSPAMSLNIQQQPPVWIASQIGSLASESDTPGTSAATYLGRKSVIATQLFGFLAAAVYHGL